MSHEIFMQRAIELSQEKMQNEEGGPFGCVIVKDGKIIAEGWNQVTSHNDPTAHAEMVAIRKACQKLESFQLTGCTIYTSCYPCPMCLGALYWARPDAMYFANTAEDAASIGFDDDFIYDELERQIEDRTLKSIQICREKALPVFQEWAEKKDKINY